jgi:hypothetical protein
MNFCAQRLTRCRDSAAENELTDRFAKLASGLYIGRFVGEPQADE